MKELLMKSSILKHLNELIEARIAEAQEEINSINASKSNETKSSAGDKYETGMAMLQMEEEKAAHQWTKAKELQYVLQQIDGEQKQNQVQLGSWVETNQGSYFMAIPIGRIEIETAKGRSEANSEIFVLSLSSPLGLQMKGKKEGERFVFQDKEFTIEKIV